MEQNGRDLPPGDPSGDPPGNRPGGDDLPGLDGDPFGEPAFLGTYEPRLDDKGRLFLPAKFREPLAGGLVIAPGQERCLYVFPRSEFNRISARIRSAPVASVQARGYQRVFLSGASPEVPDKQGRVTVPPRLRTYASLSRDCVVIGVGSRIEVWDALAWSRYLAEQEGAFADLSEEVGPGFL